MILLIIFLFFALAAFFSGMETGFISLKKYIIKSEAKNNPKKKEILEFLESPQKILGTTLLGTNISVVIVTTLAVYYLEKHPVLKIDKNLFSLIIAGFLLIFSEIIPKAVFRERAQRLVPKYFPFLHIFYFIFKPFVNLITILHTSLSKLFHIKIDSAKTSKLTFEDLSYIASNSVKLDEKEVLDVKTTVMEVLDLAQKKVENVMTNRASIVAIEENTPISEVIKIASKHKFTRYPVYKEVLDKITGILIIYDVLNVKNHQTTLAKDLVREALFVPESIGALALLSKMKNLKKSMAIINDSYGGTAGIVTIQDLIQEFMGSIYKEEKIDGVRKVADGYIINGDVEIETLNDKLGLKLPEGDYETIAGLIIDRLQEIPGPGEKVELDKYELIVLKADNTKIIEVKLESKKKKSDESPPNPEQNKE